MWNPCEKEFSKSTSAFKTLFIRGLFLAQGSRPPRLRQKRVTYPLAYDYGCIESISIYSKLLTHEPK
jgi:hypothetical protein